MSDTENLFIKFIDKSVRIECSDGEYFEGICRSIDGYLNSVLENVVYSLDSDGEVMKSAFVKGSYVKDIRIK